MHHAVVHLNATYSLGKYNLKKKKKWKKKEEKKIDFIFVLWKLGVKLF